MLRSLFSARVARASLLTVLAWWGGERLALAQDSNKSSEHREAIAKAATGYMAAFEKGDVDALAAKWTQDAEYIDESGKKTEGREAIAAMLRKNVNGVKGYKLSLHTTTCHLVTPDVAMTDGKATLTSPEGAEERTPFTAVWVKKAGDWMLRSLRDLPQQSDESALTPADRLKPFTWLLGDWVSTQKTPEINLSCRWTNGKSFLLLEYTLKAGEHTETTTERIGWDPANGRFHSWHFDSAGAFGEGVLQQEQDHWSGAMTNMLPDGRIGGARHIIRLVDQNSWVWQARDRMVDGHPLADTDVHFVRKVSKEHGQ
jgi:uncharacterized protein (TIGR02246 family)